MNDSFTYNAADQFEQLYAGLRKKEDRMYTDDEVARLPVINNAHPYYKEWAIRRKSLKRLLEYIIHRNNEPSILEIGCGNGWLSAQLATVTTGQVTGIDINETEIEQAKRVFHHSPNLDFKLCSLQDEALQDKNFDIIVFAASVQYFASLKNIISRAMEYLTLQGEIHIIDSNFYKQSEIAAAAQRTKNYFNTVGFEAMTDFYFHHSIDDIKKFNCTVLHDPTSLINRLGKNNNPFYHLVIKNRFQ